MSADIEWKQVGADLVAFGRERKYAGQQTELFRLKGGGAKVGAVKIGDGIDLNGALEKRELRIREADLTAAVNGTAQALNIGAGLPANAVVVGHQVNIATLFSGGGATAVKLDIGGTGATDIVNQMDVFTGAATGALSPRTGPHAQGKFASQQLKATITPDAGHTLLALTAGDMTITVWYAIVP